jgi:predicted DNA-binding transcriptional regulator AlpA
MEEQVIVPVDDVPDKLGGISRSQVFKLMKEGHLQRIKIGRRSFVTTESIDGYIHELIEGSAQ